MSERLDSNAEKTVGWWQPVLFAAMAGGMAWGIRGQYGHETGAMIAGLLVGLTLVFLLCPRITSMQAARAVALCTVAMGIGGSMTYGQTLGLTHNSVVVGNAEALRWGLLGCAVKGSLWIGFAGAFLGLGLGGVRYRVREMGAVMLALGAAFVLGAFVLNWPFDPANKALPSIYFSASWHWEPDNANLKPRPEVWGGVLFALLTLVGYAGFWRKDRLARNMALWGLLGGALGFPLGQCIQAYHAWNPEVFTQGIWENLGPHINWWNMMETTFGAIMGAVLGLGLWLNRKRISPVPDSDITPAPMGLEWALLAVHIPLLYAVEFMAIPTVDFLYDMGVIMAIIPITAIIAGRMWPYLVIFPITLMPIAGKTLRQLAYNEESISVSAGWAIYVVVPLCVFAALAYWFMAAGRSGQSGRRFTHHALLICAWTYFLINYAFFHFPWPWAQWTGRTPNGIIFTVCVLGLTAIALIRGSGTCCADCACGGED